MSAEATGLDLSRKIFELTLEKNVEPTEAEQQALAEAEKLFLDNQKAYQQLNREIVELNNRQTELERRNRDLAARLQVAREPIIEDFNRLLQPSTRLARWNPGL